MLDLIKANIRKEEGLKLEAYKPIKSENIILLDMEDMVRLLKKKMLLH